MSVLRDCYNLVARKADTPKQQINAAVTDRVLATFFEVLLKTGTSEAAEIISQGLKAAERRACKARQQKQK